MQSLDQEPNTEEKLEKLEQDFERPFSPPSDVKSNIPRDYPTLDDGVDVDEWYNSGAKIASGADIDERRPAVIKYKKPNKKPKT